jgi:methylated-DNA-[protein]-cysteine S-methyltransferase
MTTYYTFYDSPIDRFLLTSDGESLTRLYMNTTDFDREISTDWVADDNAEPFARTKAQLDAYFSGKGRSFDIPLAGEGTEFQQIVWKALRDIPYGETISYGELACRIGNPAASRAVGLANGKNPISIIVPCHRVIGASGKLVGYGGGLPRKKTLLALESAGREGTLGF